MDFRLALTYLALYYIRPQDWVQGMSGMEIVKPLIAFWAYSVYTKNHGSQRPQKLFFTPHDWAMLAYFLYVGFTAPDVMGTLKGFLPSISFYFLTVLSLDSRERIVTYLKWWNAMFVVLAAIGILSLYGIDLTGARDVTAHQKGRLALGTWIHNNPNSLGHSVVVALSLSYILYFWKATASQRTILFPLCVSLAAYCAYETESKGSFVVGAFLLVCVFVIGRPKLVKIIVLTLAASAGISALAFLPRMSNIENVRNEAGVAGRLLAWAEARTVVKNNPTGVGWKKFQAWITFEDVTQPIATHSSYAKIGADLGIYGLFFFAAAIWTGIRTTATLKHPDDVEMERIRRAAIILILSYCASAWMLNREYHPEYFLMIAVAAAYHRLMLQERLQSEIEEESSPPSLDPGNLLPDGSVPPPPPRIWNRWGVLDFAASFSMVWIILWFWDYTWKNL